jgi:hypothetical protein
MGRRILAIPTLLLLAACASVVSVPLHMTSQADFQPSERRAVWGRAVTSFQIAGALVDLSDSLGGVLQSKPQPTWTQCSNAAQVPGPTVRRPEKKGAPMCPSTIALQFTFTDDGMAFLRINRGVIGHVYFNESLFKDEDLKALQRECDEWLQYIVGKSPKPPEPLRPPPTDVVKI